MNDIDRLTGLWKESEKQLEFYKSEYEKLKERFDERDTIPIKSWANTEVPTEVFISGVEIVSKSEYAGATEMTAYNLSFISHLTNAIKFMTMRNAELKAKIEGMEERIEGLTELKHQNKLAEAMSLLQDIGYEVEMTHRKKGK